jgi:hypothetical protein
VAAIHEDRQAAPGRKGLADRVKNLIVNDLTGIRINDLIHSVCFGMVFRCDLRSMSRETEPQHIPRGSASGQPVHGVQQPLS